MGNFRVGGFDGMGRRQPEKANGGWRLCFARKRRFGFQAALAGLWCAVRTLRRFRQFGGFQAALAAA